MCKRLRRDMKDIKRRQQLLEMKTTIYEVTYTLEENESRSCVAEKILVHLKTWKNKLRKRDTKKN